MAGSAWLFPCRLHCWDRLLGQRGLRSRQRLLHQPSLDMRRGRLGSPRGGFQSQCPEQILELRGRSPRPCRPRAVTVRDERAVVNELPGAVVQILVKSTRFGRSWNQPIGILEAPSRRWPISHHHRHCIEVVPALDAFERHCPSTSWQGLRGAEIRGGGPCPQRWRPPSGAAGIDRSSRDSDQRGSEHSTPGRGGPPDGRVAASVRPARRRSRSRCRPGRGRSPCGRRCRRSRARPVPGRARRSGDAGVEVADEDGVHGVPGMVGPHLDEQRTGARRVPTPPRCRSAGTTAGAEESLVPGRRGGVVANGDAREQIYGHDAMLGARPRRIRKMTLALVRHPTLRRCSPPVRPASAAGARVGRPQS